MECLFLDKVSWEYSQGLYHAAAHLGREMLLILRPATPYVCIGCHQDAQQVIDLEYAEKHQIPVFRREVGGGAVYLDGGQLFYQLILRAEHPEVPAAKEAFYRKFLAPVVETYRTFGVDAVYKPVNDILANNRKVSGNGAAEINDMVVLVGNFISQFDYEAMSRVLRVPDEKFRDKVYKTLQENLSTIERETGAVPANADLAYTLVGAFKPLLGELNISTTADDELLSAAETLMAELHTPEWLLENDRRQVEISSVKIREGVAVIQNMVKTPGGLLQMTAVNNEGTLCDVHIAGDFFFYPQDLLPDLEKHLEGVPANKQSVSEAAASFYKQFEVESPGLAPEDFARVIFPGV
ncbi:MAG: hypothetical protein JXA25_03840 [Anaerolineales bacterium]|nr:hypothetical protein [Anaerolineales bacterium]